MVLCKLCGIPNRFEICDICKFTVFQVKEIIEEYSSTEIPPGWLKKGLLQLYWLFEEHPRTKCFINTAVEVVNSFIFDGDSELIIDNLDELKYTRVDSEKILNILEKANIIERTNNALFPGKITKKLHAKRWEGFEIDSLQIQEALRELQGVLTFAILDALISDPDADFVPRGAISILHMLSKRGLNNTNPNNIIPANDIESSFILINDRQLSKIRNRMIGMYDGTSKVIKDIDSLGNIELKPEVVEYLENMRERYRDRVRARER